MLIEVFFLVFDLNFRYHMLQKVCAQHQIGVLLIAHHADDQVWLAMPFVSAFPL